MNARDISRSALTKFLALVPRDTEIQIWPIEWSRPHQELVLLVLVLKHCRLQVQRMKWSGHCTTEKISVLKTGKWKSMVWWSRGNGGSKEHFSKKKRWRSAKGYCQPDMKIWRASQGNRKAKEAIEEVEKEVKEFGHELIKAQVEEGRVISGLELRIHVGDHQESMMNSSIFNNLDPKQLCTIYEGCKTSNGRQSNISRKPISQSLTMEVTGRHSPWQGWWDLYKKTIVASHAGLKDHMFDLDPPDLNSNGYPIGNLSWHWHLQFVLSMSDGLKGESP